LDTLFAALILLRAGGLVIDPDALFTADRVLRYAAEYKTNAKPLATFVLRKGGINKCAERFTRCLGRRGRKEGAPRRHVRSRGVQTSVAATGLEDCPLAPDFPQVKGT